MNPAIDIYEQQARDARQNGDVYSLAFRCGVVITDYLADALREGANITEVKSLLIHRGVEQYVDYLVYALGALRAGRPDGQPVTAYTMSWCTHLSLLINNRDWAVICALASLDAGVVTTTPFWREYCRGLVDILRGAKFNPGLPAKLRRVEKNWAKYVNLIAALTSGNNVAEAVAAAREALAQRNGRKSVDWNAQGLEGDAYDVVRVDLRVDTLLGVSGIDILSLQQS